MELADLKGLEKVRRADGSIAYRYPYRIPAQDGHDKFDDTLWWEGEDGIADVTEADVHDELDRRYQNWIEAISPPAPTAEDYAAQAVDLDHQIAELAAQRAEAVDQAKALDPEIDIPEATTE
jgi:hypothetical protein